MSNDIRNLLQIKDPKIHFEDNCVKTSDQAIYIHCCLSYTINRCPCCEAKDTIVKNGTRTSRITYLDVCGQPCYLLMKKQRYRCNVCRQCFTAKTSLVEQHCHISLLTKQRIISYATKTLSEKEIAQLINVSSHTVRRVIDACALTVRKPPTTLPEHLCFDEFKATKSCKGAMAFICCDALSHQVVDVVEDRRLSSLKEYFYRYDRQERKKVQTIVIDFYPPYMELIRSLFPNAKIMIDRFHLVQALNRELNRYRVQFMNRVRYKDTKLYNKLKRYWRYLLMNPDRLVYATFSHFPLFNSLTNTEEITRYLLNQDVQLKECYETVHRLVEALRYQDFERVKRELDRAKTRQLPPGLKRILRTFNKSLDMIRNTCEYPELSNGPLEGINNKIKVLKRNAYGYRNYNHFRNRILLISRLYVSGRHKKGTKLQKVA